MLVIYIALLVTYIVLLRRVNAWAGYLIVRYIY